MYLFSLIWLILSPSPEWKMALDDLEIYGFDGFTSNMVAVADDGSLMLKDQAECRLIFIGPDGRTRKVFGRQGRGPDEFFAIDGIGWVKSEQAFYVTDRGNLQVSKFDRNGNRLDAFRTKIMRNPVFGDGALYYMKRNNDTERYQNAIHGFSLTKKTDRVLFKTDMEMIATVMVWHGQLLFAPGSDFLAATHTDTNQMHILDPETGETLEQWKLNVPRIPLDRDWRDAYMKDFTARVFSKGRPPKGFRFDFRDQWPYLHTIKVDPADRIWIFLHRSQDDDPVPYRVFDRHGKLLKSGKISGIPQAIASQFLYLIEMTEQGSVLERIELDRL